MEERMIGNDSVRYLEVTPPYTRSKVASRDKDLISAEIDARVAAHGTSGPNSPARNIFNLHEVVFSYIDTRALAHTYIYV